MRPFVDGESGADGAELPASARTVWNGSRFGPRSEATYDGDIVSEFVVQESMPPAPGPDGASDVLVIDSVEMPTPD